eukprot:2177718-Amphidinium_carterae.1
MESHRFRKEADKEKKKRDGERVKSFPPLSLLKQQVKVAMTILQVISTSAQASGWEELPFHLALEATTAVVGIIAYNSSVGKSGEWSLMQASHVREQLSLGAKFLVCPEHKTAASYGTWQSSFQLGLGRHLTSTSTCQ